MKFFEFGSFLVVSVWGSHPKKIKLPLSQNKKIRLSVVWEWVTSLPVGVSVKWDDPLPLCGNSHRGHVGIMMLTSTS